MSKERLNKEKADVNLYYNLLTNKIDKFKDGENVLLIHLGNSDVIYRFIVNNMNCNYFIIDQPDTGDLLKAFFPQIKYIETEEDESIIDAMEKLNMKFDKIIMNPPYSKNLHLKILAKAIEQLTEDGECINLSPIRWLQDPLAKYKKSSDLKRFEDSVAKHIESIDEIDSKIAGEIFQNALNIQLGIYTCKINPNMKFNMYSNRILDKVLKMMSGNIKDNLIWKTPEKYTLIISLICGGNNGRTESCSHFIFAKEGTIFNNGKNKNGETLLEYKKRVSWGNVKPKNEAFCIEFNSEGERTNFINSCETIFIRYIFKSMTVDVHVHPEFLPWMGDCINPRTGLKGYESEWTNEDFYTYFNITKEEQELIEKTMEKYM